MKYLKKITILSLIIFLSLEIYAQKKYEVKIIIPKGMNNENISVYLNNGKESNVKIIPEFLNNTCTMKGIYYSEYATVSINLKKGKSKLYGDYWITNKKSVINIKEFDSDIPNIILINALDQKLHGEGELEKFKYYEQSEYQSFKNNMKVLPNEGDSLHKILIEKKYNVTLKEVEFVKTHTTSIYAFNYLYVLIYSDYNPDSLRKIYDSFPKSMRNSYDSKRILKAFHAKSLTKGKKAPDFKGIDMFKQRISLKDLKGKYVLLNFWASWCRPCIEEMPTIAQIHDTFPKSKINVISVSQDADYGKFKMAIEKYNMNWTNILDKDLITLYGDFSIPKVFLINPDGIIIYTREEEKDYNLSILIKLLQNQFNQNN